MTLNRPLLGNRHDGPVALESLLYMVRARPGQNATALCRGLVKPPAIVVPAIHAAVELGLIRKVGEGYVALGT